MIDDTTPPWKDTPHAAKIESLAMRGRGADVRFRANTGRSVDPRWMSANGHKRTFVSKSGLNAGPRVAQKHCEVIAVALVRHLIEHIAYKTTMISRVIYQMQ